jgi:hypothetical protein
MFEDANSLWQVTPADGQHAKHKLCKDGAAEVPGRLGNPHRFLGNSYVSLASTGEIRKITPDGQQSLLANLPGDLFPPGMAQPNGIAYRHGWLYVADSFLGLVWRVHADGQSPAEV